ncbi:TonB-dependent receptor [Aureivirga sp. CE67]|uniref:TonB-dependent receptor n=1 Tax=Aureivirga sp. CE67 TaxID=1788983 RepID=UPI0018C94847|nr:TonB-dependent receptor [Aureivirga sp. CE67]
MRNTILSLVTILLMGLTTYAQNITVKGKVTNEKNGNPLLGVTLIVENSEEWTTTDEQGEFTLENVKEKQFVEVSMIGFISKKVQITGEVLEIKLKESTLELETVVVSASRTTQNRKEVPIAISAISAKTIEEEEPNTADQVLNQVAGVNMVDLGNEQHMMSIRQPISTKSLFLYLEDGIPIRPTGVFNHNALLEMNLAATRQIEVIRGPYSSLYGSEAVGGAINFLTANPTKDLSGAISVRGNSNGYERADVNISKTFGKTGVYLGGYRARITDGYREYGDFNKTALSGKINHEFSEKLKWTTTFSHIKYRSDMSGSIGEDKFYDKDFSSNHTFTFRDVLAFRLRSTLSNLWNENNLTSFTFVYRDNSIQQNPSYRIDNGAENDSYTFGELNENRFNSYGAIVQHNLSIPSARLKFNIGASLDFSPNTFKAEEIEVYRNAEGQFASYTQTGNFRSNYAVDLINIGSYLTVEYALLENLIINGGLRFDSFNYDFTNRLEDAANFKAPNTVTTFNTLTPRIGSVLNLKNNLNIYGNFSKGFVPPSVGELYKRSFVPELDPAKFTNYEIGFWKTFFNEKVYIDIAAYYLKGKDEIVSVTVKDGDKKLFENRNAGETKHYGLEYSFRFAPTKQVHFRTSGAFSQHEFVDYVTQIQNGAPAKDYSGKIMPTAPSWVSNTEIAYTPNYLEGFRIAMEWQHINHYYTDEANTNEYAGYDLFNLRTSYKFKNVKVWANFINVFDKLYSTRTSTRWGRTSFTPGAPSTVDLGIKYQF